LPSLITNTMITNRISDFNYIVYYTTFEGHFPLLKLHLFYLKLVFSWSIIFPRDFKSKTLLFRCRLLLNLSTLFLWWRAVLLSKATGRLMSTNFSGTNFPRCEASGSSVECQMASPQQRDPHLVSDRRNKLPVTSHSLNFNWIHVYIGTSSILWTMKYRPLKNHLETLAVPAKGVTKIVFLLLP
jgi:hypothetical protein